MAKSISVETWSEDKFLRQRENWQALLERSSADPLFMSWEWQSRWWQAHRDPFDLKLRILAAYAGDRLVGLAPFSLRTVIHRGIFTGRRLELLGHLWRQPGAVMSEFLDLIIDSSHALEVSDAFARYVTGEYDWDELVVANTCRGGNASDWMNYLLSSLKRDCYLRHSDAMTAHAVDLCVDFDTYVKSLTSNTRRKMIAHRKRLDNSKFRVVALEEIGAAFELMGEFHIERWGGVHFSGLQREFHLTLAKSLAESNVLRMSILYDRGAPMSILYNIRLGKSEYNIQSAFSPSHPKGLSPGYLHLGLCIEEASRNGVVSFHLLGGEGRNRDYKRDICDIQTEISSIQLVRSKVLRIIYRAYDSFRKYI